jgi:hypothetical protein
VGGGALVEEGVEERDEGDPRDEGVPAGHGAGHGKAEVEQNGGDESEKDGDAQGRLRGKGPGGKRFAQSFGHDEVRG